MLGWLRKWVRARYYIDVDTAAKRKEQLALTYVFISWILFGAAMKTLYQEKIPKVHDSYDYAKIWAVQDAKVIKIRGTTLVDEYKININDEDIDEFIKMVGKKEEFEKYEEKNLARIKGVKEKKEIDRKDLDC